MKTRENERRDSGIIIILILLLGLICIILASGWALRFAPSWKLNTNMGSNLNPNGDFLTSRPVGFIEPLDPAILTNPVWIDGFLTPGISFPTRTPRPASTATLVPPKTSTSTPVQTLTAVPTNTFVIVVIPPTNTKIYIPPPPATATPNPPPTNTPVTPPPSADLQITKTDNATDYIGGISVQYIIVASNPIGPSNVTDATVTDTFSTNLDPLSITWTCAGAGGAICTAGGAGNINDVFVNLPVGGSVTYTVNATVIASPTGPLVNTATVGSSVTDPNPGNNSATDTDLLVTFNCLPYGNIGDTVPPEPDGSVSNLLTGGSLTLQFFCPPPPWLVVGSHAGYDLVYYPAPTLQMDIVLLEIGDGSNWYPIFYWGDGLPDTNTDINPADCPLETDNCVITNPSGINIDLDGIVPNGTYNYIRISSLPDSGDGVDVDAIAILP